MERQFIMTRIKPGSSKAKLITIDCSKINEHDAYYIFEVAERNMSIDGLKFTVSDGMRGLLKRRYPYQRSFGETPRSGKLDGLGRRSR
jgi:hypothetical protein